MMDYRKPNTLFYGYFLNILFQFRPTTLGLLSFWGVWTLFVTISGLEIITIGAVRPVLTLPVSKPNSCTSGLIFSLCQEFLLRNSDSFWNSLLLPFLPARGLLSSKLWVLTQTVFIFLEMIQRYLKYNCLVLNENFRYVVISANILEKSWPWSPCEELISFSVNGIALSALADIFYVTDLEKSLYNMLHASKVDDQIELILALCFPIPFKCFEWKWTDPQ